MISAQRRQVAHLFLFMSLCKGFPNTGAVPSAGKILAIMTSSAAALSHLASTHVSAMRQASAASLQRRGGSFVKG